MKPLSVAFLLAASPLCALDLGIPDNALQVSDAFPADTITLPDAAWQAGAAPRQVEGDIARKVYRVPGGARTTLQLMEPMRAALTEAGFAEDFTCADTVCGGFDFRFQLDLIGEPAMHVDLGDFRYLLATRDPSAGDPHSVAIVTSRSADAGYIHVTEVATQGASPGIGAVEAGEAPGVARAGGSLVDQLVVEGHVVLDDLDFGSGSAELGDRPSPSLAALAEWLIASNGAQVVLVGHTDAVGSLEANTALSLQRARAVAARLVEAYGVSAAQVDAHGAGYLAPVASNLSDTGRALNRRVEVVLLSGGN